MKLSVWAKRVGVHYKTAHRWFQQGVLPVDAGDLETDVSGRDLLVRIGSMLTRMTKPQQSGTGTGTSTDA